MVKIRATNALQILKKKSGCLPIKIILGIFFLLVLGRYLSFWDFEYFDIIHYFRPTLTFEETMELINPLPSKGYSYPAPSSVALNRTVDCRVIYSYPEFPRMNPLCLNLFRTSADDITKKLAERPYDRIVLYGERSVFDSPTSSEGEENYIRDLYNTIKFMDLIAIPKFLAAYGLTDVSYINSTKPYPYLFYRISNLDDSDKICHYGDTTEKVQGCARGFYSSIIPLAAVGPQLSDARPLLRHTDNQRFSYLTHYPEDCYTNDTFAHETSHLLSHAVQSETKVPPMPVWFDEQVAGMFGIYGAEIDCGAGTVTSQKGKKKDTVEALLEFNTVFPAIDLSHEYPEDNTCRQAILTQWYRYLVKGNYQKNFKTFFTQQRSTTPNLNDDAVFAKFLMGLDPDPFTKPFLESKGCTF